MTRKDTIIAAVLVNAGLLIVLFSTALKQDPPTPSQDVALTPIAVAPEPLLKKEVAVPPSQGDEVDQILKQYAQVTPAAAPAPAPSFADDLKAIAKKEEPPVVAPAVVAAKAPASDPAYVEYKVKKGDMLEKIARHHQSTVDQIMKANHLTSSYLKIGQTLKIPKAAAISTIGSAPLAPVATDAKYYVIKPGDNPWTIAMKHHMKLDELLKLNGLNEEKARKLKPGDELRIR